MSPGSTCPKAPGSSLPPAPDQQLDDQTNNSSSHFGRTKSSAPPKKPWNDSIPPANHGLQNKQPASESLPASLLLEPPIAQRGPFRTPAGDLAHQAEHGQRHQTEDHHLPKRRYFFFISTHTYIYMCMCRYIYIYIERKSRGVLSCWCDRQGMWE